MRDISLRVINTFFDWLLNQRRRNGGRVCGIRSANTLGTHGKVFRLVYKRATGDKIKGEINRKIHGVYYWRPKSHRQYLWRRLRFSKTTTLFSLISSQDRLFDELENADSHGNPGKMSRKYGRGRKET
jgi:hypothetical protein